ncbi:MAG: protease complex subunit PrcB family protein [Candidatus Hydrogenedentes bacterium]|nr:protease complex subunit PrcB family protein [Candidatus Hydrogenedentota bacterium]
MKLTTLRATLVLAMLVAACACRSSAPEPQVVEQDVVLDARAEGGYTFKGPYGLAGTLTYGADGWSLNGVFQFPTGGYRVSGVDVNVLKSLPEQVHITIYVSSPPKDAMTTQVITEVAINRAISVSSSARFAIRVTANAS